MKWLDLAFLAIAAVSLAIIGWIFVIWYYNRIYKELKRENAETNEKLTELIKDCEKIKTQLEDNNEK